MITLLRRIKKRRKLLNLNLSDRTTVLVMTEATEIGEVEEAEVEEAEAEEAEVDIEGEVDVEEVTGVIIEEEDMKVDVDVVEVEEEEVDIEGEEDVAVELIAKEG